MYSERRLALGRSFPLSFVGLDFGIRVRGAIVDRYKRVVLVKEVAFGSADFPRIFGMEEMYRLAKRTCR